MGRKTPISHELFNEIKKKTNKGKSYSYEQIKKYANFYNIRQHHAAIKLASDLGINIKRFADDDYFDAIGGRARPPSIAPTPIDQPKIIQNRKIKPSSYPQINLDFSKIRKKELAKILKRDQSELNWAIKSGTDNTSKTCMILSGSIAEALLLERLTENKGIKNKAIQIARSLPKNRPSDPNDLESWSLVGLISVSEQLGLIHSDIVTQIGQLKDWRNLVHPGKELKVVKKKRMKITTERAENAIGFLKALAQDIN